MRNKKEEHYDKQIKKEEKQGKIIAIIVAFSLLISIISLMISIESRHSEEINDKLTGIQEQMEGLSHQVDEWEAELSSQVDELETKLSTVLPDPQYSFVNHLYRELLGISDPEPKGQREWAESIINGKQTGEDVVLGIVSSLEFKKKYEEDDEGFVYAVYKATQGHALNDADVKAQIYLLENLGRRDYVKSLMDTVEFEKLCEAWSVNPHPESSKSVE